MTTTAVVTGGSSGIGEAVVARLAELHDVVVIDRVPPGDGVLWIPCDLTDPRSIALAAESAPGHIEVLVNVAGVSGAHLPRTVMAVNLFGTRDLTRALLPRLADGARIVTVASTVGVGWRDHLPLIQALLSSDGIAEGLALWAALAPDVDAYRLSKEAVTWWTRTLAAELLPRRIRVNSVSPGAVSTSLLDSFYATLDASVLDRARDATGRFGHPAEIAEAVVFLADRRSSWINGTDLVVDGGAEAVLDAPDGPDPTRTPLTSPLPQEHP